MIKTNGRNVVKLCGVNPGNPAKTPATIKLTSVKPTFLTPPLRVPHPCEARVGPYKTRSTSTLVIPTVA
jgi:hypothetical protein